MFLNFQADRGPLKHKFMLTFRKNNARLGVHAATLFGAFSWSVFGSSRGGKSNGVLRPRRSNCEAKRGPGWGPEREGVPLEKQRGAYTGAHFEQPRERKKQHEENREKEGGKRP